MAGQARRTYASVALTAALALTLGACASLSSPGAGDEGAADPGAQPEQDVVPDEASQDAPFLLQVKHVGGFVPMGWDFASVPQLTIYPDGLAVVTGPTTMEYPGRFLPNLLTYQLTEDQVAALVAAAEEAGLLAEAPDYGFPPVADAGATVVTLQVDGATYVHQAEALEVLLGDALGGGDSGLPEEAVAARQALGDFIAEAQAAVEAAGTPEPYQTDSYAYLATEVPPLTQEDGMDVLPTVHAWPLAEPLAETACTVVEGADADTLGAVLEEARQNDRFEQDGTQFEVHVRPMLPGDPGCTGAEQLPTR